MKTTSIRAIATACLAVTVVMNTQAALTVEKFTYRNGTESGPGTVTYAHVPTSRSGDAIQVLTLDASNGGNYVASAFALAASNGVAGTHVRFRVRAPLVNKVGLRVIDSSGQTLQFAIDRANTVTDDQGWSTVTLPVTSSAEYWPATGNNGTLKGNIMRLQLTLARSGELGKIARAYFRGIEVLPTANDPVLPRHVVDIQLPQLVLGTEHGPVNGTLDVEPLPANTGDDIQVINFSFPEGSGGYGAAITDVTPAQATYARFRLLAPVLSRIRLQVVDTSEQTLQYDIDRTAEVVDSAGWASHAIRLDRPVQFYGGSGSGKVEGAIRSVRLLVRAPGNTGGPSTGTAYFKEVDLLNSAPSPSAPLMPLVTRSTEGPVVIENVNAPSKGAVTSAAVDTTSPVAGLTQVLSYNLEGTRFSTTPKTSFTGVSFRLTQPTVGNRLRFMAKVPQGVSLRLRLKGTAGETLHEDNAVKPLGTVDDLGWVQYAIKLNALATIAEVQLGIRRNTNLSVNGHTVEPVGTASFGQVWVGQEADQLDLSPSTPTFATIKRKGTDPLPSVFGVTARDLVNNAPLAKSLGFNHVRMDMSWSNVETVANTYKFDNYDNAVRAVLNNGMTPILILAYNNKLYSGQSSDKYGVSTGANRDAYVRFAKAAARHYKSFLSSSQSIVFEIWNEPNISTFWQPSPNPADYAAILSPAAAAIKTEDSRFKVLSAGLSRIDFPFLAGITPTLASLAASRYIDGVGVHPYTMLAEGDVEPETQADETLAARRRLKDAMVTVPVWNTEVGFSSANLSPEPRMVDGTLQTNRVKQAQRVLREVLTSVAVDSPSHVVYQLKDAYPSPYSPYEQENNFGVVDKNGVDKPLKTALNALQKAVSGLRFQGMVTGSPSAVQAMKFTASGKDTVYIVWANGAGAQANVSILPNCQTNFNGAASTGWSSCVMDVGQQSVSCTALSNGRYSCPVSETRGPLFVRTRGQ